MLSDREARLREFERSLTLADAAIDALEERLHMPGRGYYANSIVYGGQIIDGGGGGICDIVTTFHVTETCGGTNLSGIPINVYNHTTGALVTQLTTNSSGNAVFCGVSGSSYDLLALGSGTPYNVLSTLFTPSTSFPVINFNQGPNPGYINTDSVVFSGGGGSGANATLHASNGQVTSVTMNAGGTGYSSPPTVSFVTLTGFGATATASIAGGAVTGVTVTNKGLGQGVCTTCGSPSKVVLQPFVATDSLTSVNLTFIGGTSYNGGHNLSNGTAVHWAGGACSAPIIDFFPIGYIFNAATCTLQVSARSCVPVTFPINVSSTTPFPNGLLSLTNSPTSVSFNPFSATYDFSGGGTTAAKLFPSGNYTVTVTGT